MIMMPQLFRIYANEGLKYIKSGEILVFVTVEDMAPQEIRSRRFKININSLECILIYFDTFGQ